MCSVGAGKKKTGRELLGPRSTEKKKFRKEGSDKEVDKLRSRECKKREQLSPKGTEVGGEVQGRQNFAKAGV